MDIEIKARLNWVELFLETNNSGYVCSRGGISRPTLRKWVARFKEQGMNGLYDKSTSSNTFSNIKINYSIIEKILALRKGRNLGVRQLQTELIRLFNIHLSIIC